MARESGGSLYDVLGVAPTASEDEVRAAYRRAARRDHPDTGGSAAAFERTRAAYRVLGDPERRHRYDLQLASALDPAARPEAPVARPDAGWPPSPDARTRRRYFVAMAVCLTLFVLAGAVVRTYSVPAAIAMMAVAAVIPPAAAIVANRSGPPRGPQP